MRPRPCRGRRGSIRRRVTPAGDPQGASTHRNPRRQPPGDPRRAARRLHRPRPGGPARARTHRRPPSDARTLAHPRTRYALRHRGPSAPRTPGAVRLVDHARSGAGDAQGTTVRAGPTALARLRRPRPAWGNRGGPAAALPGGWGRAQALRARRPARAGVRPVPAVSAGVDSRVGGGGDAPLAGTSLAAPDRRRADAGALGGRGRCVPGGGGALSRGARGRPASGACPSHERALSRGARGRPASGACPSRERALSRGARAASGRVGASPFRQTGRATTHGQAAPGELFRHRHVVTVLPGRVARRRVVHRHPPVRAQPLPRVLERHRAKTRHPPQGRPAPARGRLPH